MTPNIYGYCRISNPKQNIERQQRNILELYPSAKLYSEAYTGTSNARPQWNALKKKLKSGDKVIFDSVSRMSRNAEQGVKDYFDLFERGIELEFMKEPHINSTVYRKQLDNASLGMTDNKVVNAVLEGVEKALKLLAEQQIEIAFEQAEKEVMDLRQRTKEGLVTAKLNGKQIGRSEGQKVVTKKSVEMKAKIKQLSKAFDGHLKDKEVLEYLNIDRMTYYKYKKEMKAEVE